MIKSYLLDLNIPEKYIVMFDLSRYCYTSINIGNSSLGVERYYTHIKIPRSFDRDNIKFALESQTEQIKEIYKGHIGTIFKFESAYIDPIYDGIVIRISSHVVDVREETLIYEG